VLYQAGASGRGLAFAAQHAEVVFLTLNDPRRGARQVEDLRRRAAEIGRDRDDFKVLQGIPVIVGCTAEEAQAKVDLMTALHSPEGRLAKWCGWMNLDLAAYPEDTPIDEVRVDGTRTPLEAIRRTNPNREWRVGDVIRTVSAVHKPMRGGRFMLCGTPGEVAGQMERWIELADVDGFNLVPCPPSTGIDDICDLLVPELQRRGLFRTMYDPARPTLRERYFGVGRARYRRSPDTAARS
jgi:alkanesulfonate monooxygenase SsuD/methylene tetrahydromethanopterin reductase-like flavin-dependent oxidoreductase (luciferase family)